MDDRVRATARTFSLISLVQHALGFERPHLLARIGVTPVIKADPRARSQFLLTRARVSGLQAQTGVKSHRLAALTGKVREAPLSAAAPLRALPPPMDPGAQGELLRRRPDVSAAEARLAASVSRVGVSRADLFPRFTMGGLSGSQAADAAGFFGGGSHSPLASLGIDWSFLDFRRVRARLAASRADVDTDLAGYECAILHALEATENALVHYARSRQRDADLDQAAADSTTAAKLAHSRLDAGVIRLLEVLEADRSSLQVPGRPHVRVGRYLPRPRGRLAGPRAGRANRARSAMANQPRPPKDRRALVRRSVSGTLARGNSPDNAPHLPEDEVPEQLDDDSIIVLRSNAQGEADR